MNAGRLRERITVQQKSVSRDTYGDEVVTWVGLATLWASVEPATGVEFYSEDVERNTITTRIRLRWRDDLAPAQRVVWGASVYDIRAVIHPHSNRRELDLLCVEVVQE